MAVVGIGTAGFLPGYGLGSVTPLTDPELIEAAVERGVRYIDTAAAYGPAEEVLGTIAELVRRERVRVCTKIASAASDDRSRLVDQLRRSLARLRLDSVDTVLLHSADPAALELTGAREELATMKEELLASRVGLSTYGADAAARALALPTVDSVQVEHSILNPSVVRRIQSVKRRGQEVVARSVLCKGLLSERWRAADIVTSALAVTLEELERIAANWGFDLPGLALRYALDTPGIDVVVVGVSTLAELSAALAAAAHAPLDSEQLNVLMAFDRSADDVTHPERWAPALS